MAPIDFSRLRVRPADAAEIAAHEAVLDGIERQCKGGAVWRRAAAAGG